MSLLHVMLDVKNSTLIHVLNFISTTYLYDIKQTVLALCITKKSRKYITNKLCKQQLWHIYIYLYTF